MTQIVDMGSLVRDGMGGEKKGLTFDIRPTLPVVTQDQRCFGKMDRFGGMYCCFGGLMGSPMFPNGSFGVPGEGWGEWRKKMVILGILG